MGRFKKLSELDPRDLYPNDDKLTIIINSYLDVEPRSLYEGLSSPDKG
jgi:hypothetical protein